jgi:aminoglycoside 6-adenylyltransferase
MRAEQEILDLILDTAKADERIRAVILNGSRANPRARKDIFQDFDVIYVVNDADSFVADPKWIERFGERMILQMPDAMGDSPPQAGGRFAYLMQFADGHRIDLTLLPATKFSEMPRDSLSVLLLDKDGAIGPLPSPSERDYLPRPPSAKAFAVCCNEFWWVCPYVAKGLWRGELLYAKHMLDGVLRKQLVTVLTWQLGAETGFARSFGAYGRHLEKHMSEEQKVLLARSYADAMPDNIWDSLEALCTLFREAARRVAERFGFDYPEANDTKVSAHLRHVRRLPRDAKEVY